jgi:hypothetical protein
MRLTSLSFPVRNYTFWLSRRSLLILWSLILILSLALQGCEMVSPEPSPTPTASPTPSATPLPQALITFRVTLPEPLPAGDGISVSVLDEVTGLALNLKNYPMQAEDSEHFLVILPFTLNSVIKYRYARSGQSLALEHTSDGRAVRYRLHLVDGPGIIQDVISRWTDTEYSGSTGRISGQITDAMSGTPIPNIMIEAGGEQTFSTADGSFILEGLPPGNHSLVAYALNGAYRVYQQGAVVAAGSTTPAPLHMTPAKMVNIVFNLSVPPGTLPAVPVRFAGNLYQLGNTFADLTGGISTLAARMPVMSALPDGRYTITLSLPAGADLRYKYTLGDGLWNAERLSTGEMRLRELVVPESNVVVEDRVDTWSEGKSAPITFDINVPTTTPPNEIVSIQLNPSFGWTTPIPMWPVGNGRWIFVLYNPLDTLASIGYRFCRNDQCGSADDSRTKGSSAGGQTVNTSLIPEKIDDTVTSWAWLETSPITVTVPNVTIKPRTNGFISGVEFQPYYNPSWQPRMPAALQDIHSLSANWVILTPTWTYTRYEQPVLEPVPGNDALWPDELDAINQAHGDSFSVALFPTPSFPSSADQWWKFAPRDFPWWVSWFDSYRNFLLNYADMASYQGAQALIVGGDWIIPALPNGVLADGSPSMVPEDALSRWRNLLTEVKAHYKGTLVWALPYPQGIKNPPSFLDAVDQIYLLWSAPIALKSGASAEEMAVVAGEILDKEIKPFMETWKKPMVLALTYPSARGGSGGCIPDPSSNCLDLQLLSQPNLDIPTIILDLDEQVRAYSAMLMAVNDRDWIGGIVSRGYYPPAILEDKSASIHGKPARGVLWYWFPRLLGTNQG